MDCSLPIKHLHPVPDLYPLNPAGALFTHSILDKYWTPEVTEAEAVAMIDKSIEEIKLRLVVAPPHYMIKVIDANGIRTVKEV
jgi:20S proteasome subunit beta 4